MHSGRARLTQLGFLAGAIVLALTVPGLAGTAADPEIVDPASDQGLDGQTVCPDPAGPAPPPAPAACTGGATDITSAWVSDETDSIIKVHLNFSAAPAFASQYNNYFSFGMTYAGTDLMAGAAWLGGPLDPGVVPTGVASAAAVNGTVLTLTIPKSAFAAGPLPRGAALVNLFASAERNLFGANQTLFGDRAPDGAAFGRSYNFTRTAGGGPIGNPADSDGDGLNNTFEQQYFNDANSTETATGDPDGDACDNACEQKSGTDPTEADTDGDGIDDNQELLDGTDPNDSQDPPPSTTTPPPTTSPPPVTTTTPPPTTTTPAGGGTDKDEGECEAGDVKCFTSGDNFGYTIAAVVLFIVILIVCLVALMGRWAI